MNDRSRQKQETGAASGLRAPGTPAQPEIEQTVRECLATNYGLGGRLERLPGENLNFLVTEIGNKKHIFKIVDEHMPPDVVAMEFSAIEYAIQGGFRPRLP
jgi:hypothetical protein